MKFVKEEEENREDFIFQKNKKTIFGTSFTIVVLVLLVIGVVISGMFFEWF
ncbi:hypothetical protein NBT05_01250 [Aquimarina sp. ERC-38]|uniref:hypothetical protein n=1 Tax=Aquimarina sp. ERC-38 TaxID=2949996 RepID=UPI002245E7DC|nr:hypothetical protein [Aquimarina sp. ERC-38]UZO81118.1 hypothetical protein NBT05_01250 [Aquimarina sp. ERC-38]